MKKLIFIVSIFATLVSMGQRNTFDIAKNHAFLTKSLVDSTSLPTCIAALCHTAKQTIKSKVAQIQIFTYVGQISLKNGKNLYALRAKASLNCDFKVAESINYYNKDCDHVATFYSNFSIAKGLKPFIAEGYFPVDFPESTSGNYSLYFRQEYEKKISESTVNPPIKISSFAVERSFQIVKVLDSTSFVKKGDVIHISAASGFKHFRNNKLLDTYKIIPQMGVIGSFDRAQTAFYMDIFKKFVDISEQKFLISSESFDTVKTPTIPIPIKWQTAFELLKH